MEPAKNQKKIGVTGHRNLDDPSGAGWVEACIREKLQGYTEIAGLTSLAKGADQIFARVVLGLGGTLDAVLPFPGYAESFTDADESAGFHELIVRCRTVTALEFVESNERSYLAAGQYVVDHSEILIAVWDGEPAAGVGGTADVVAYARQNGKPVCQINPVGRWSVILS